MHGKFLYCFILSLFLSPNAIAQTQHGEDSIFWDATRNGKTIFLLGSIHSGFLEQYPLPKKIQDAFGKSAIYVTETMLPFLPPSDAQAKIKPVFKAKMGKNLKTLLEEKNCRTLAKEEEIDANLGKIFGDKLLVKKLMIATPGTAIYFLSAPTDFVNKEHEESLHLTQSIEFFLSDAAAKLKIRHESLDWELFEALNNLDDTDLCNLAVGMASTRAAGNNSEEITYEILLKLKNYWLAGDSIDMVDLAFQWPPEFSSAHGDAERKWFESRNEIMAKKMIAISESTSSPIFVTIGASHLAGKAGVISQLKKAGYDVRPR